MKCSTNPTPTGVEVSSAKAQVIFEDLEGELRVVGGAPVLERVCRAGPGAGSVNCWKSLDNIALNRLSQIEAGAARSEIRLQAGLGVILWWRPRVMVMMVWDSTPGLDADDLRLLQGFVRQGLSAGGEDELEVLWNEAALLSGSSTDELGLAVAYVGPG